MRPWPGASDGWRCWRRSDLGFHERSLTGSGSSKCCRICSATRCGTRRQGGLVAMSVGAADGSVRIEVRDTGEGIDAEDLPHVFERFFRGRNNAEVGAGLGLALVAELTHAMGGEVVARSTPSVGSCFEVRLNTEG